MRVELVSRRHAGSAAFVRYAQAAAVDQEMGLSKRIRFEVFKRDSFTCQYCGKKAPDVVLHVDHVHPKSKGGTDDVLNLVTSCADCNMGKGARELSDSTVVERQRQQLEELQERREQIEMMVEWQRSLMKLEDQTLEQASQFWSEALEDEYHLNEAGKDALQRLLNRYDLAAVLEGMRIAVANYVRKDSEGRFTKDSVELAWDKVGGICYNRHRWQRDPLNEIIDKAWWRFRERYRGDCSHWPEDWQLRQWWREYVEPVVRSGASEEAARRHVELAIDMCLEEYHSGPHGSYWSALQQIGPQLEEETEETKDEGN